MKYKMRDKIIEVSQVIRYHGNPGPTLQNIAAHSWGVAWLITEFHPEPTVALVRAALEHDLPEHITSDVSFVSKKLYPPLREAMDTATEMAEDEMGITSLRTLSDEDVWWLKWADLLEGCLWCRFLFKEQAQRAYLGRWNEYRDALESHMKSPPVTFCSSPEPMYFTKSVYQ